MKKVKNQKGFTLIELIVVIAILGILALIAVPRFAGFTDKAKISNDKELESIVEHSVKSMIASQDIKLSQVANDTRTVTFINKGDTLSYSVAGITPSNPDFATLVGKHKLQYFTSITITFDPAGEVTGVSATPPTGLAITW